MKAANFQVVLYLLALGIMVLMLHEGVARIIDLATAESAKNCFRIQIESISGRKGMTLLHPPGVFSDHVCGSG